MPQDSFALECDRLSQTVDSALFERLRWARTEGPMLAHLVTLAHAVLEEREEIELTEEGATNSIKRFVLKVHSNRVAAITMCLKEGQVLVWAEEIERSRYKLAEGSPLTAEFHKVDQPWMASAFQELFSRIRA